MTVPTRIVTAALAGACAVAAAPGSHVPLTGEVVVEAAQFPGGFGGTQQEAKLTAKFDKDKDKRLSRAERHEALEYLMAQGSGRAGRGGRSMFGAAGPVEPGTRLSPTSVRTYPASVKFYDLGTVRTLFFEFEDADWEDQLTAFKETDIEVPAALTVDGKMLQDVGVQFRGQSSFMMVPEGRKRSLNVTIDAFSKDQQVLGYNSLNLLNSHEDATYLRSVLFLQAARDYLPAAQANFVRVVINGESWGIYSNVQQVDKAFLQEWFKTRNGTRWKVPGSPGARGGLEYVGPDVAAYKRTYEIKGDDDAKAWNALVNLTRVLNETPVDKLEASLAPILDIDGALRFLALDNALVNNDGYWVRASDYNLYLDTSGRFHILPHDTNETFATGAGRGRGGRRGGFGPPPSGVGPPQAGGFGRLAGPGGGRGGFMMGGPELDPLIGLDDSSKPLRSRLLAVPAIRSRYLAYTKEIAAKWLNWVTLEPLITRYHALIAADVRADTHKLDSVEAFEAGVQDLKAFAERRLAFLLNYSEAR